MTKRHAHCDQLALNYNSLCSFIRIEKTNHPYMPMAYNVAC